MSNFNIDTWYKTQTQTNKKIDEYLKNYLIKLDNVENENPDFIKEEEEEYQEELLKEEETYNNIDMIYELKEILEEELHDKYYNNSLIEKVTEDELYDLVIELKLQPNVLNNCYKKIIKEEEEEEEDFY